MGFWSRRSRLDREEGLTLRDSARSSTDDSARTSKRRRSSISQGIKDSAKRVGRRLSDATDRFKDSFNNYEPPRYDISGSESERRSVDSSGEEASDASTAPSSVGFQTPSVSNFPSRAVSPVPITSQDTDDGRTRKVNIPREYEQTKKMSAFDDLSMAERNALAKQIYLEKGTEEDWDKMKDPYKFWRRMGAARAKYDEAVKKATETGEETKVEVLPKLDIYAVIAEANNIRSEVRKTLACAGGAVDKDVDDITRLVLSERLDPGSLRGLEWPGGCGDKAKPPSDDHVRGLLRGKEEHELYEDWRVLNQTLSKADGTTLTEDQARQYFRQNPGNGFATFKRSDPICSQLTNFRKFATGSALPPKFEQLNETDLKRVEEIKGIVDKAMEGGGTEADTKNALDEAYGPVVTSGPRHVFFSNAAGTMTGTMEDGTVVTMTCGSPRTSTQKLTTDTGDISVSELLAFDDPDGKIRKEWDQRCSESTAALKELAAEVAAEEAAALEAIAKAKAEKAARLRLMPSKNKATDLLTIPKTATIDSSAGITSPTESSPSIPVTSWNGYDRVTWESNNQELNEHNAKQARERLLKNRNINHLLSQKFPELDKETLFQLSSAYADSGMNDRSFKYKTVISQMPEVLAKHGYQTTSEDLKTLFKSNDRPRIGGRTIRHWATRPSARPGTAEPVSPLTACSRLMGLSQISSILDDCQLPVSSQSQRDEISGWVVDLFDAATSGADKGPKLRAAILRAKKGLEENPEWIPDANTTLEL